ncbi:MAG TPA: hypothetical protein RMH99_31230, partial [Sandaracinaceae bacterium LLY-WYZ-13_1]|nr:hypothetical protein [Sandaracinaceae bacterium LLY-WYZ-13_1]
MGVFIEMVPSASTSRATADRVLRQLGKARAKSDHELCLWLLSGFRLSVHDVHGYASFREYAERVFGFTGRATEERLRTAGALEHLPGLSAAFEAGEVLYSVVREVTRVAVSDTEADWLRAVEGKKAAEVARMVSGRERGDRPSDPGKPEAERHRVGLNLGGASRALWEQARQAATRRSGGTHVSDDDFVTQLALTYLAHAGDHASAVDGRAVTERPAGDGGDATEPTDATEPEEAIEAGDATEPEDTTEAGDATEPEDATEAEDTIEAANATEAEDATEAGDATEAEDTTDPEDATEAADATEAEDTTDPDDATEAADAKAADANETTETADATADDATGAYAGAREVAASPADGRAPYQIALTICDRCGTATQDAGGRRFVVDETTVEAAKCDAQYIGRVDGLSYDKAAQSIRPAVRRAVARRHGNVCAVPGCTNATCHVHHLEPRAEGGSHGPDNLIWICDSHHRAVHDGRLVIRGTWSTGFRFEHADGRPYGSPKTDGAASRKLSDTFEILCSLGFRQSEARRMIDGARPHVGAGTATEDMVRLALRQASVPGVAEERAEYLPVRVLKRRGVGPHVGGRGVRGGAGSRGSSTKAGRRNASRGAGRSRRGVGSSRPCPLGLAANFEGLTRIGVGGVW